MMKKTEKEKFGFAQFNYIWGLRGNTYPVKDELKAMGFRFSKTFLWTLVSEEKPQNLPEGITPFKIEWDKISYTSPATGEERLISDKEIAEYLDTLRYESDDTTSFEGEIGERIERTVKVLSVKEIHSNYGTSFLHQFETEDGNLLTWFTQSLKQNFEEGEECLIRATIREHKVYRGKKQTVVNRVLRRNAQKPLPKERKKRRSKLKKDLTGRRFGRLVAIRPLEQRAPNRQVIWRCKCDCGESVDVRSTNLLSGNTKSCGCLNRQKTSERSKDNLVGQKFGLLTVIKETDKRSGGCILWECKCDCGNIAYVATDHLKGIGPNATRSCGCLKQSSFGVEKIKQLLTENNIPFETEKRFETCRNPKTNAQLPFDFFVNNEYLIEFDGRQHFEKNNFFNSTLEETQYRDKIKTQWCKDNNIRLIRIPWTKAEFLTLEDIT